MNKTICIMALTLLVPFFSFGQRANEWSLSLSNGLLMNKSDINVLSGGPKITYVPNTFTQNLYGHYTHVTKYGFLYSAGLSVGYEQYKSRVDYPFTEFKFKVPTSVSDTYRFNAVIPNLQLGVGIGYRLKHKWQPEIRVYERAMLPLKYQDLMRDAYEIGFTGLYSQTFSMYGTYGKNSAGFHVELLTALNVGVTVPKTVKVIGGLNIGLQYQTDLLVKSYTNYYRIDYRDYSSTIRSKEEFRGSHTAISLLLGFTL